ncbi:glycosyltransferase [Neiella marina]|uniref:Glycosyltransferase n=1 Tax=Neiella holothuriorum TaxID=2870530 RepID=A0ABS7EJF0_9GAMM|nr:glycosyltransferase [Neiella holothuriorum]MBW8192483.1 glycosyltransferase [Neiella holothuriorum]
MSYFNDKQTALLVFGEDWGRHPSSTQHIVRALAEQRRIIWVNSIGLRRPRLSWRDGLRVLEKLANWWRGTQTKAKPVDTPTKMTVIQPLVFPAARSTLLRRLNVWLVNRQINRVRRRFHIRQLDLWISLPTAVDWLGSQSESHSLYYCGDDFSALAGVDHAHVARCETQLISRVNTVCAASKTIQQQLQQKAGRRKQVQLLPHGVDIRLFSKQVPRPEQLPPQKLIAGFYGSIASWLDLPLIKALAQAMPNWHFVLMGNVETDVEILRNVSNIQLLPAVAHHQLPGHVQHWQAALLPFHDCAQIKACNPLKLREYLASGTPVISTPFPALKPYRDVVQQASSLAQWQLALARCQRPVTQRWRRHQQLAVAAESWDVRARQINHLLQVS